MDNKANYSVTSNGTGRPSQTSFYDAFGREVRTSVVRYDGTVLHSDIEYDSFGRPYHESLPFTGSSATLWNTTTFDVYDRPTGVTFASGNSKTYSYSGKNVTKTVDGITSTFNYDAQGNLTSVTDPAGTITYNLRPDGQPSSIVAPGNITTDFGYDNYGRQTGINDPSAGNRSFQYDNDGNLWKETDSDNRVKTMLYDPYGRITKKVMPEFTVNYRYDNDGLLAADSSDNGAIRTFIYDTYFRLQKERDNADNKWLEKTYVYSGGNLSNIQFESDLGAIGTEYYTYANGHLSEIKLGSTSVWQLTGENSLGQTTSVTTGSVARTYNYNAYGVPTGRVASTSMAGAFQNHTYSIDALKGNLSFRKDNTRNLQENFTYDNLNRLKTFAGFNMEYDAKGNILEKSDAGVTFYYNTPNKPYAISGVDAGTNTAIPPRNQTVTYTSFERPASISENNYQALFTYSGAGERKKMEVKNNNSTLYNRYYLGGRYETDLGTSINSQRLYIGGNAYSAPAVYVNQGSGWALYNICRDHLGSITHLISYTGTVANEYSYDAWGRLRDPVTQIAYAPGSEPNLLLGRGYTGHEHLAEFGLVNMNARLYDPAIGRFLNPDPYIADAANSLDYNRYLYARNNPLVYSDPTGEKLKLWHWLLGDVFTGGAVTGFMLTNYVLGSEHLYKLQQMTSPIAFKPTFHIGSDVSGKGFDLSVGMPTMAPGYRWHWGGTYYEMYYDNAYSGWEWRSGSMATIVPGLSYSGTTFSSDDISQTTNMLIIGGPIFNISYENDYEMKEFSWVPFVPKGSSDKFRSAAVHVNLWDQGFGFNIFTGDPGNESTVTEKGQKIYTLNKDGDPDKYRFGGLFFKFGPVRVGGNSEGIRSRIQNKIHDWTGDPHFRKLDRKGRFYWYFGTGTGNSLW